MPLNCGAHVQTGGKAAWLLQVPRPLAAPQLRLQLGSWYVRKEPLPSSAPPELLSGDHHQSTASPTPEGVRDFRRAFSASLGKVDPTECKAPEDLKAAVLRNTCFSAILSTLMLENLKSLLLLKHQFLYLREKFYNMLLILKRLLL